MSQLSTSEYSRLKHRLAQARRAWKRTEILSGAVVVLIEILGAVALAMLADVLFALNRPGRVVLLVIVAIVTLVLMLRHILVPLLRRITDAQLALYLEERNSGFEGALIAAVEFGADHNLTARQKEIIEGVLREAVLRVERFDLSKALDLRRLRKYGIFAVVLTALYLFLGAVIPESIGHYMARIVTPWRVTPEEIAAIQQAEELKKPITITLSRGNARLLRGSSFDLEATLSRKPNEAVQFHFRSFSADGADSAWKQLPLQPVERLNGYQFSLPDVNEDLQFFVASGEFKSTTHRISVYDPIILQNTQLTIHYPDYANRPDETLSKAASPDVAVLTGSTVTVTFESNRPLKQGRLVWENGTETAIAPNKTNEQAVTTSFDVTLDTTYTYTLTDIDGQSLDSPGPVTVRALPDNPPTLKLLTPDPVITSHPLGEFLFSAEIKDDIGIAGTDLVFSRGIDPSAAGTRLPLPRDQQEMLFMLESLSPPVQPGDLITCYLECRDLKGQKAVSDLVMITVVPFDIWNAWAPPEPEHPSEALAQVEAILMATWSLHAQKDYIAPVDFNRQAEELAATMIDPETQKLLQYVDLTKLMGESLEHANKAIVLIEQGHKDLSTHTTDLAIGDFRAALSELALAGLTYIKPIVPPSNAASASKKMEMMEEVAKTEASADVADMANEPTDMTKAEKNQADQVEDILKKQQALVELMKQTKEAQSKSADAQAAPPPPPADAKAPPPPPADAKNAQKQDDAKAPPPPPADAKNAQKQDDAKAPPPPPADAKNAQKQDDAKAPPPPPADAKNAQKQDDAKAPPPPPADAKNAQKQDDAKAPPPPPADAKNAQKQDAAALAAAEKALAAKAKEVADALNKKEVGAKEETRMDAASRNMFESSQALELKDKDKAIQKAETAIRELERLVIELKARSEDEFGRLLDAAERTARNMLKEQVSIRTKTETLAGGLGRGKPNAIQERTLKILASQQAQVKADLEPFANILAQLRKISEGGLVRPGTAKQLEEADLHMTRARVPQKAANATIELISGHPGNAVSEQQKAEEGLAKVLEAIRIANDARAAGYEAELKRAKGEADRIVEALARIEGGDASAAATAVDEAQRLARHLQQRDLTKGDEQSGKDAALLGKLTEDAVSIQKVLQKTPKDSEFAQASSRLQSRLDADYQELLAAKKLFSSQREECPPQYRQLVNQYFEALSTESSKDTPKP